MRFSTIAVTLLSGLTAFKGVVASPVLAINDVQIQKRQTIVEVVNDLKTSVVNIKHVGWTGCRPSNPGCLGRDAQSALQSIVNAISSASAAVPGSTTSTKRAPAVAGANLESRDLTVELAERQADDLSIVGAVLAEIITDIVEAVAGLADDLKALPLIGALIIAIDGGLNTLLVGVQVVLVGVVQILQGLLAGLGGLLASLGTGLLADLLFGLS